MPEKSGLSEQILIKNCRTGQVKHLEKLYRHYYGYAMGVGLRYSVSRDDAMETVNDTFLKVFSNLEAFDDSRPFKPWLRRLVINTALDRRRKEIRHLEVLETSMTETPVSDYGALEKLAAEDILRLLDTLAPLQKIVFNMYEIDGYRHEEIAGKLNIPASSSRVHLARAKEKLRNMWLMQEGHGKAV